MISLSRRIRIWGTTTVTVASVGVAAFSAGGRDLKKIGAGFVAIIFASCAHAQTFEGYECTDDCSGHEAGYEWAEENGVSSESDCGGNSSSFEEGCAAFVESAYPDNPEIDAEGNEIEE